MSPRVSVCIPTYNGAQYLRECLDSVLCQTFQNYDILIIDDKSSDGTLDIINEYSQHDNRITLILNDNNIGLVKNMNNCIYHAKGEWIKFVCQDDLIEPDCLKSMLSELKPSDSMVACRRTFLFDEYVTEETRRFYLNHLSLNDIFSGMNYISSNIFCKAALTYLGINFIGEPTSVMFRKDISNRYGLLNVNLAMLCDIEYWSRIAIHCGLIYIPEDLAVFRVHSKSASAYYFANDELQIAIDGIILLHDYIFLSTYRPLQIADCYHNYPFHLLRNLFRRIRKIQRTLKKATDHENTYKNDCENRWNIILKQYHRLRYIDLFLKMIGRLDAPD